MQTLGSRFLLAGARTRLAGVLLFFFLAAPDAAAQLQPAPPTSASTDAGAESVDHALELLDKLEFDLRRQLESLSNIRRIRSRRSSSRSPAS
jgi:hypothetical protein